mgnify:FL=1
MIKYLSTIVLTVALCCACDGEDFSADPTLMPPATQTGANTFGCLIDGWYIQDNAMDRTIKHPTILLIMKMKKQQSMYTFGR